MVPRLSDSATPRSTVIVNNGWNAPPEVRVFSPHPERQVLMENITTGSQPNVMDASIQEFDVPAFL